MRRHSGPCSMLKHEVADTLRAGAHRYYSSATYSQGQPKVNGIQLRRTSAIRNPAATARAGIFNIRASVRLIVWILPRKRPRSRVHRGDSVRSWEQTHHWSAINLLRSEERRVGKEGRSRW